jgi:hypothetical protein
MLRLILRTQALVYFVTGLWPLLHLESFEAVGGATTDDWLVQMVGLLLACIAVALWLGTRHRQAPPDRAIVALGALAAASVAAIDLRYALAGRISSIYLVDAAFEILLVVLIGLTVALGWSRQRPGF